MARGNKTPVKWTEATIRDAAAKCVSRSDFKENFPVACKRAREIGILDEIQPRATVSWNESLLRKEAAKYQMRSHFEKGSHGAFKAMSRFPGLLDEVLPAEGEYDYETCLAAALTCENRESFRSQFGGMYSWVHRNRKDLLITAFGENVIWDDDAIRAVASKYQYRNDFFLGNRGAYIAAWRRGMLDELLPEFREGGSDNDAIYIWRAVGQYFNGEPVYKIGVTSARLGTHRIERVAGRVGFEHAVVCCQQVACRATDLEKRLLMLGDNPGFVGFDGATEFRAMSDAVLWVALGLISEVAVKEKCNG